MRVISMVLALLMLFNPLVSGMAGALEVKGGTLSTNEVWSGEVKIKSDVTVPQGVELKIEPGTVFLYDKQNGQSSPKLNVYGTLKIGQASGSGEGYELVPLDQRTKIIRVSPYEVDTNSLKDEFHAFRTQYVVLWTILSLGLIYAVASR